MPEDYNPKPVMTQTKFFISTKADCLTERVNLWIKEHMDVIEPYTLYISDPVMSYTTVKDKGAYMIGCMIQYGVAIEKEEK